MALKTRKADRNVVEYARKRIKNIFSTAPKVYLSTSGGKDSICLMHLIYSLIKEKKIDPSKLVIRFIDEEAMFDDVINIVKKWRKRFIKTGAKFNWYCLQLKHFNCLNSLSSDESFIMWDSNEKENWVRDMPEFAVTYHPAAREKIDRYQQFLTRISKDGVTLIGIRMSESVHRLYNMATVLRNKGGYSKDNKAFPIYDWKTSDVWLYIKKNDLEFPHTYIDLYRCGTSKNLLRISEFFSIDTARILQKLERYQPGLMERVIKREPNAYMASIYWNTEIFRRPKGHEKDKDRYTDYKKATFKLLKKLKNENKKETERKGIRTLMLRYGGVMKKKHWKKAYLILKAGDVKNRAWRALSVALLNET